MNFLAPRGPTSGSMPGWRADLVIVSQRASFRFRSKHADVVATSSDPSHFAQDDARPQRIADETQSPRRGVLTPPPSWTAGRQVRLRLVRVPAALLRLRRELVRDRSAQRSRL